MLCAQEGVDVAGISSQISTFYPKKPSYLRSLTLSRLQIVLTTFSETLYDTHGRRMAKDEVFEIVRIVISLHFRTPDRTSSVRGSRYVPDGRRDCIFTLS